MTPQETENMLNDIAIAKQVINEQVHPLLKDNTQGNYQASYLNARLEDIGTLIQRMAEGDQRSIYLAGREAELTPQIRPLHSFSKRLQKVLQERSRIAASMRLDYESLFVYGNLALDHWARMIATLCATSSISNFAKLYHTLSKPHSPPALDTVSSNHMPDIIWLYYNLRNYRNGFIEHLDKPMQRGTSSPAHLPGFSLWIPSAVGSVSDERISELHTMLLEIGSDLLARVPENHWQRTRARGTLQLVLHHIDRITDYSSRESAGYAWTELGGETVSYGVLARRLVNLLMSSPDTILPT